MGEWIPILVPIESPIVVSIIHSGIPYEEPDRYGVLTGLKDFAKAFVCDYDMVYEGVYRFSNKS